MSVKVFVCFIVAVLVGSVTSGCNFNAGDKRLHDFHLEALDGSRFYLTNQRGKIVVMVFWSVYCVPCHRQLGDLSRHALLKDEAVKLVSVCVDPTDRALVEQGAKITSGRIPTLLDRNRAVSKTLGVKSEPTTLVIDSHGAEINRIMGYDTTTLAQIEKTVALLKEGSRK